MKQNLALAVFLSCALIGAHAQTQQVAFIGDNFISQWSQSPEFTSHSNWKAYVNSGNLPPTAGSANAGTAESLASLQLIIQSGRRPIVMIDTGADDLNFITPGNQTGLAMVNFAEGMEQIIATAQAAHLTLIVGTVPFADVSPTLTLNAANQWLMLYCQRHNVPVVNYAFALDSGSGFAASGFGPSPAPGSQAGVPQKPVYYGTPTVIPPNEPVSTLTSQGFDLVTDMAETGILLATGGTLKSGYLQNVVYDNINDAPDVSTADDNTMVNQGIVQFTPYGQYSDGSTHIMNNADALGHIGTWTSSDTYVLNIDQNGVALGLSGGSANIQFTTNSGTKVNEWTQYVNIYRNNSGEGTY